MLANGPLLSPEPPSLPYTWAGKPAWHCRSPMFIPWHLWGNRPREQRAFQRTQAKPGTQEAWPGLVFHGHSGRLSGSPSQGPSRGFQLLPNLAEGGCGSPMLLLVLNSLTGAGFPQVGYVCVLGTGQLTLWQFTLQLGQLSGGRGHPEAFRPCLT